MASWRDGDGGSGSGWRVGPVSHGDRGAASDRQPEGAAAEGSRPVTQLRLWRGTAAQRPLPQHLAAWCSDPHRQAHPGAQRELDWNQLSP